MDQLRIKIRTVFNNNFYFIQIFVSSYIECNYKVTVNTYLSFIIISSIILVGDQYQRCNHLYTLSSGEYLSDGTQDWTKEYHDLGRINMKVCLDLYNVCCIQWNECVAATLVMSLPEDFRRHRLTGKIRVWHIIYKCRKFTTGHYILYFNEMLTTLYSLQCVCLRTVLLSSLSLHSFVTFPSPGRSPREIQGYTISLVI